MQRLQGRPVLVRGGFFRPTDHRGLLVPRLRPSLLSFAPLGLGERWPYDGCEDVPSSSVLVCSLLSVQVRFGAFVGIRSWEQDLFETFEDGTSSLPWVHLPRPRQLKQSFGSFGDAFYGSGMPEPAALFRFGDTLHVGTDGLSEQPSGRKKKEGRFLSKPTF